MVAFLLSNKDFNLSLFLGKLCPENGIKRHGLRVLYLLKLKITTNGST
jgi:hypothetical protein